MTAAVHEVLDELLDLHESGLCSEPFVTFGMRDAVFLVRVEGRCTAHAGRHVTNRGLWSALRVRRPL
jgi:hypothetical protein